MKKILLIMAVLFIANLGCKKMDNGGGLCACSPMVGPEAYLTIKNSNGVDLLNDKNAGAYTKDKVQIYVKAADGAKSQISVSIRPNFDYGNNKYTFYSIYIPYASTKNANDNSVYLKLGEKEYKLTLQLGQNARVEKMLIDGKEATKEASLSAYLDLFYLTE